MKQTTVKRFFNTQILNLYQNTSTGTIEPYIKMENYEVVDKP